MNTIACFHLNQVGDLGFSLPALKSLRDGYPDARIVSLVRPSMAELLGESGLVNDVVPRAGGLGSRKLGVVRKLRALKPDLAVVLSQSADSALLAYLSRAPRRVGFINTTLGVLLTERVGFRHPPSTGNNLRLIEALGCPITAHDYVGLLKPTAARLEKAERLLAEYGVSSSDRVVALAPGTSGRRSVKEWTDEGFGEVARHLGARGVKVLHLGSQPSSNIVQEYGDIIDLGGRTSLVDAAAVLAGCCALVAVDSGLLHLGAAAGTKIVGLYGPSNHEVTGPQGQGHRVLTAGLECSPCMKTECKIARKCMTDIDAQSVIDAVDSVLDSSA